MDRSMSEPKLNQSTSGDSSVTPATTIYDSPHFVHRGTTTLLSIPVGFSSSLLSPVETADDEIYPDNTRSFSIENTIVLPAETDTLVTELTIRSDYGTVNAYNDASTSTRYRSTIILPNSDEAILTNLERNIASIYSERSPTTSSSLRTSVSNFELYSYNNCQTGSVRTELSLPSKFKLASKTIYESNTLFPENLIQSTSILSISAKSGTSDLTKTDKLSTTKSETKVPDFESSPSVTGKHSSNFEKKTPSLIEIHSEFRILDSSSSSETVSLRTSSKSSANVISRSSSKFTDKPSENGGTSAEKMQHNRMPDSPEFYNRKHVHKKNRSSREPRNNQYERSIIHRN